MDEEDDVNSICTHAISASDHSCPGLAMRQGHSRSFEALFLHTSLYNNMNPILMLLTKIRLPKTPQVYLLYHINTL